ncbi:AAA family ATPase, partial [Streptomyces sp. NPDC002596]
RRRDALAAEATGAADRLAAARERALGAHERWLELREQRLRDIAAELAAELVDGEACKVCGSGDHPEPARAAEGHVDRAAEEAALAVYRRAEQARTEADRELGVVREKHAAARAAALPVVGTAADDASDRGAAGTADDGPHAAEPAVVELEALVAELAAEHAHAHRTAAGMHAAREALAVAEREQTERREARQQAERRSAARTSRREGLDREQAGLEAELTAARGESGSVAAHAALLERRVALLADAAEAVRAEELAARRSKEADGRLADAAFRAGFDTPEAAAATLLTDAEHRDIQHRIDGWQAEAAAVAEQSRSCRRRCSAGSPRRRGTGTRRR